MKLDIWIIVRKWLAGITSHISVFFLCTHTNRHIYAYVHMSIFFSSFFFLAISLKEITIFPGLSSRPVMQVQSQKFSLKYTIEWLPRSKSQLCCVHVATCLKTKINWSIYFWGFINYPLEKAVYKSIVLGIISRVK